MSDDFLYVRCTKCKGLITMSPKAKDRCTCISNTNPLMVEAEKKIKIKSAHDIVLKIVEDWQFFWMNQTLDEEDTKRYRERACGIDANMRHNLAERITKGLGL